MTIRYATRISADGIYLHQLNETVWAQGNTDTSHGCLNLNGDNAQWFYNFSVPGDVVEVRNTGGRRCSCGRTATGACRVISGARAAPCPEPSPWPGDSMDPMFLSLFIGIVIGGVGVAGGALRRRPVVAALPSTGPAEFLTCVPERTAQTHRRIVMH